MPASPDHASPTASPVRSFIDRWTFSAASERANAQSFVAELCGLLGVAPPAPATGDPASDGYVFERTVAFLDDPDGRSGFMDLYKRGHFVFETKQGFDREQAAAGRKRAGHGERGTPAWERTMQGAQAQAARYARNLGPDEPVPPFLVACDVGHCLDLYADFSGTGRLYVPFPDPGAFRIPLADLERPEIRERLRLVFADPLALDPGRRQAQVTRQLARRLARLAAALEADGHHGDAVFGFLTRCLFSMYAEDVGLLPERSFSELLRRYRDRLDMLPHALQSLWQTMNAGGFAPDLQALIPAFNGGLFAQTDALPLSADQYEQLVDAAESDWHDVEPAIFGTLLEQALDPRERHALGAHYTPRAYVERLVFPAVIAPLREEWDAVRAAVTQIEAEGKGDVRRQAVELLRGFLHRLTHLTILDPACGSGNFLYVTLEHLKRLEAEVRAELARYGEAALEMETAAVTPKQLLGLEVNPRAAAIADLVLWIGYLQWHLRTQGGPQTLRPPILQAYGNIRHADAVLNRGEPTPRLEGGEPVTRWDGFTTRPHPATGEPVPDETARVPVLDYPDARPAAWPEATFIVGNPPFVGGGVMRSALGDGYTEALRAAYPEVPQSADFVMYWWHRAAEAVRQGRAERFGLITTNSVGQTFNRRVIERHVKAEKAPMHLAFAVPDHPWVEEAGGAAVRIAMTVGAPGEGEGVLARVSREASSPELGYEVELETTSGTIHPDLSAGADVSSAVPLKANLDLSSPGVKLHGSGFIVTPEEAERLGLGRIDGLDDHIRPYRNGRDLTATPRGVMVIDLFGLSADEARDRFPAVYQHLLDHVKPERDQNRRATYRDNWWIFGEPRRDLRPMLDGLPRYIATVETAKHRTFQFLPTEILPDNRLICIATDEAFHLGVLSSRIHVVWALGSGGTLEDRPVYNKTICFDRFPFPEATDAQAEAIRALGERLDAHRKRVQADHPELTLTALYNVLEAIRAGESLSKKDQAVYERGLVGVLRELHDALDAAVAEAYGWPVSLPDEAVLARLVALNRQRRAEEEAGRVRYLRPAFQAPDAAPQTDLGIEAAAAPVAVAERQPWPATLPERMLAVRRLLARTDRPLAPREVARHFTRARTADVAQLLETLALLGHVREGEDGAFGA